MEKVEVATAAKGSFELLNLSANTLEKVNIHNMSTET